MSHILKAALGALAFFGWAVPPTVGWAATYQYNFDVNYCSTACTFPAGHVDVTEVDPDGVGPLLSYLHYSVTLTGGTLFRTNHTSFLLQLDPGITGLTATNVVQ